MLNWFIPSSFFLEKVLIQFFPIISVFVYKLILLQCILSVQVAILSGTFIMSKKRTSSSRKVLHDDFTPTCPFWHHSDFIALWHSPFVCIYYSLIYLCLNKLLSANWFLLVIRSVLCCLP